MASPTPGVYTCQTCNALFTCLDYYQQHRRNHAECNGIKLLTCGHCPYSTDNAFHYNWHNMSHNGVAPHRCQVCQQNKTPLASTGHTATQAVSTQATGHSPAVKPEPGLHHTDSISDDEPSACALTGKRSVATATTDDLLLSSGLQSTPQTNNSCRMSSKGIMTSLSDHNNFYNLKTIDPSDLMDTKYNPSSNEEEEEDDDEEEEEEEDDEEEEDEEEEEEEEEAEADDNDQEYVHKEMPNRLIESDDDEEEEDDDEEEEEEESESSEDEAGVMPEFGVTCVDTSVQNTNNNSINNNIIINNINITNNNITNSSTNNSSNSAKRVKTSDQSAAAGDGQTTTQPKPRGRGKGNRKSRVNAFFEGSDITGIGGVEGIRRKFHCSHCGKSFKTKSHLQRHILTHTGEKPYHCNRCGSKFNQSSSLRNHIIAIHTKEYPHYCPNCNKGFLMPALLQKHLATSHRNK